MDFDSLVDDNAKSDQSAPAPQAQAAPLKFDDLKEDDTAPKKFDDLIDDSESNKYSTPGQQALTVGENFAKGAVPFAAQYAENKLSEMGVPGISPQEQYAREKANPWEAGLSKGAGNVALMMTAPEVKGLSVVGGMALNNALQMGVMAGSDEYSKSLMGHGDPTNAVAAHIIGATALGGIGGTLFGNVSKWLPATEGLQAGSRLQATLAGAGHQLKYGSEGMQHFSQDEIENALQQMASVPEMSGEASLYAKAPTKLASSFKFGQKIAKELPGNAATGAADIAGGIIGAHLPIGGTAGALISDKLVKSMGVDKWVSRQFSKAGQKYLGNVILKVANSGKMQNLAQAMDYAGSVGSGAQTLNNGLKYLFNEGSGTLRKDATDDFMTSDKERDAIKDFQDHGGVNTEIEKEATQSPAGVPSYAQGGVVPAVNTEQSNAIADYWPTHNILLNATRGRVSQYLASIKPSQQNNLLFDSDHKNPQQEREYDQAIDLVNRPLSVLKHVKDGTLVPKHVTAIKSVFPEVYAELSNKIMQKLIKDKTNDEKKLPYHMRQSLSLFLGGNTDSTMTQPNIMAAQNVFVNQKAQQSVPNKSDPALDKMGKSAQTPGQAREKALTKT